MTYSFGWWDFVDGDEPQMVCRDTDERVVMVGDLAEPWLAKAVTNHPDLPKIKWKRFEYRHAEFWFPLIVNWQPDEGKALVDYNLSSELWRQETNADTEYPPYGGWVRVDDMVPDAFWCWPGFLEAYLPTSNQDAAQMDWFDSIKVLGGYLNTSWSSNLFSCESLSFCGGKCSLLNEYLYLDFECKPIIGDICPLTYNNKQVALDKIKYAFRNAHIFSRSMAKCLDYMPARWEEGDVGAGLVANSEDGVYLQIDAFERLLSDTSNQNLFSASIKFEHLKKEILVYLSKVKDFEERFCWGGKSVGYLCLAYLNPVQFESRFSYFTKGDWLLENFDLEALNGFNRRLLDAVQYWNCPNLSQNQSAHCADSLLTVINFLGGVFATHRCRHYTYDV